MAIAARGRDPDQCRRRVQAALDRLAIWCRSSLMEVSVEKSEFTLLVPSPQRARLASSARPPVVLRYAGAPLSYSKEVRFLGVTLVEALTAGPHCERLKRAITKREAALRKLAGADLGCSRRTLRTLHLGYVQSKVD